MAAVVQRNSALEMLKSPERRERLEKIQKLAKALPQVALAPASTNPALIMLKSPERRERLERNQKIARLVKALPEGAPAPALWRNANSISIEQLRAKVAAYHSLGQLRDELNRVEEPDELTEVLQKTCTTFYENAVSSSDPEGCRDMLLKAFQERFVDTATGLPISEPLLGPDGYYDARTLILSNVERDPRQITHSPFTDEEDFFVTPHPGLQICTDWLKKEGGQRENPVIAAAYNEFMKLTGLSEQAHLISDLLPNGENGQRCQRLWQNIQRVMKIKQGVKVLQASVDQAVAALPSVEQQLAETRTLSEQQTAQFRSEIAKADQQHEHRTEGLNERCDRVEKEQQALHHDQAHLNWRCDQLAEQLDQLEQILPELSRAVDELDRAVRKMKKAEKKRAVTQAVCFVASVAFSCMTGTPFLTSLLLQAKRVAVNTIAQKVFRNSMVATVAASFVNGSTDGVTKTALNGGSFANIATKDLALSMAKSGMKATASSIAAMTARGLIKSPVIAGAVGAAASAFVTQGSGGMVGPEVAANMALGGVSEVVSHATGVQLNLSVTGKELNLSVQA